MQSDADTIVEFQQLMAEETEGKRLNQETVLRGVISVFEDQSKVRGEHFGSRESAVLIFGDAEL